jgi:UDP-3-O-[3-hydroxymyristoyl] N-acetylglucosamine deacetylase
MLQTTIKKSVEVTGIGLHSGKPISLKLNPATVNSGINFINKKSGAKIKLNPNSVIDTKMATVIGSGGFKVSTIEHFLSALYAYGIDNLDIIIDGQEMPIMDGSAISFCMMLDEAKIIKQDDYKSFLVVKKEVTIKEGNKFVTLKPSKNAVFNFEIDFNHPIIGRQKYKFNFSKQNYIEQIARARTFGFAHEIQYLQSINLALGASLDNAIGLDENSVLNPEGLRFQDEFVRHKILDAMGDLKVTGFNIIGEYSAFAGSHDLNHKLTKKLLSNSENYEIVKIKEKQKAMELAKVFA